MPNINAAIGCSQFNKLKEILKKKRHLFKKYENIFKDDSDLIIFSENRLSKRKDRMEYIRE